MTRSHNLFFALCPPRNVGEHIDHQRQAQRLPGPWLPRERLHVPLLSLGRHPVLPMRLIDQVSETVADEVLSECSITFDQFVVGRRSAILGSRGPLLDVEHLQAQLSGLLARNDITHERRRSKPGLTLGYNILPQPVQTIDPIGWTARELVLIDSIYGESKHLIMARWSLDSQSTNSKLPVRSRIPAMPVSALPKESGQQLSLFA